MLHKLDAQIFSAVPAMDTYGGGAENSNPHCCSTGGAVIKLVVKSMPEKTTAGAYNKMYVTLCLSKSLFVKANAKCRRNTEKKGHITRLLLRIEAVSMLLACVLKNSDKDQKALHTNNNTKSLLTRAFLSK